MLNSASTMHHFYGDKEVETSPGPAPRILVIEDKAEELTLLVEMLRMARYDIVVAFDGVRGYKRAVARPPDLILLDVQLGGDMNGFAVCRLLKAEPALSHVPVIFLTASKSLEDRLTGFREGAVDYIVKPFEPDEVIARIEIHLRLSIGDYEPVPGYLTLSNPQNDAVLVEAACRLIERDLASIPSLSEIAKSVGTYEKRLTKAFRDQKGMTGMLR